MQNKLAAREQFELEADFDATIYWRINEKPRAHEANREHFYNAFALIFAVIP
jgi:hypothetical protein